MGAKILSDLSITKSIEAITSGQKRILLNLATGTGKTSIAFQICWKLFQGRWNVSNPGERIPNILFLADRNILADQALNSFNEFAVFDDGALAELQQVKLEDQEYLKLLAYFLRFIKPLFLEMRNPFFGEYSKDFFDLIIIDECHRGGAGDTQNEVIGKKY